MTVRRDVPDSPVNDSNMLQPKPRTKVWFYLVRWLCSDAPVRESVSTSLPFEASPQEVWQGMLSYEEVPIPPPFILRTLLPFPVRTEGDKTRPGEAVQCLYRQGHLVKQITVVEPPALLEFEVHQQHLGIEDCISAIGGSYRIRPRGQRTEIELVTNYRAYLKPRWFWRPVEQFLGHVFHRHILRGMRYEMSPSGPATIEVSVPQSAAPQEPPCTTSL